MTPAELVKQLEQSRARVIADAVAEATAAYWIRRAEQFAGVGNPRCDEIAQACRNHASLMLGGGE